MAKSMNYNRLHNPSGTVISGTNGQVTVGDIRDAIAEYPDDTTVSLGVCGDCGAILRLSGFKSRGEKAIQFRVDTEEIEAL